jgi:hypothetical protein
MWWYAVLSSSSGDTYFYCWLSTRPISLLAPPIFFKSRSVQATFWFLGKRTFFSVHCLLVCEVYPTWAHGTSNYGTCNYCSPNLPTVYQGLSCTVDATIPKCSNVRVTFMSCWKWFFTLCNWFSRHVHLVFTTRAIHKLVLRSLILSPNEARKL